MRLREIVDPATSCPTKERVLRVQPNRPGPMVSAIARILHLLLTSASTARRRIKGYALVGQFASRGRDFVFDPDGNYSFKTIRVGDNVNLGARPTILATRSSVVIGNHVMFGPGVTIRGGNHRFDILGKYIDEVTDEMKRPVDDLGVVIGDDVWVGGGATILHGVTIGRGSVIAANAVVTKSIAPYSIAAGNPARIVRERWNNEQILEHERILSEG